MERSCLGDSCLVKCDGEMMRQTEKKREMKMEEGRGKGVKGVNDNKQHGLGEDDRWDWGGA